MLAAGGIHVLELTICTQIVAHSRVTLVSNLAEEIAYGTQPPVPDHSSEKELS